MYFLRDENSTHASHWPLGCRGTEVPTAGGDWEEAGLLSAAHLSEVGCPAEVWAWVAGGGNPPSLAGLGFGACSEHQKEPFNMWQPASKLEWKDNAKWMHCIELIHLSSRLLTVKLVLSADA